MNDGSPKKRARIGDPHAAGIRALNESFAAFVTRNPSCEPLAKQALEYLGFAQQLDYRYGKGWFDCSKSRVHTFGTGDFGQLGNGTGAKAESKSPKLVDALGDVSVLAVDSGGLHNAIVSKTGELHTWGCSDNDCLGREGDENYPKLVEFPSFTKVLTVSCGDSHTVCCSFDGRVFGFGSYRDKDGKNWFPTLGFKNTAKTPVLLMESSAVNVCGGNSHTLCLTNNGEVYSWGIGESGQLGRRVSQVRNPTSDEYYVDDVVATHLKIAKVDGVDNVLSIGAGGYHSFVIREGGEVMGCGLNQYGQLGANSSRTCLNAFESIPSLSVLSPRFITGGEHFSVCLNYSNTLFSWGRSDQSQLGASTEADDAAGSCQSTPVEVHANVVTVACGGSHTLFTTVSHELYSFGFGETLQLGNKKEQDEKLPHKVEGGSGATKVSAGAQHSVVLLSR